ncbi:MAG: hypothetical protein JW751_17925 [Polyangiaceae bacterium]|nr:hypothetical protein [Polyangiaceae bacterium]
MPKPATCEILSFLTPLLAVALTSACEGATTSGSEPSAADGGSAGEPASGGAAGVPASGGTGAGGGGRGGTAGSGASSPEAAPRGAMTVSPTSGGCGVGPYSIPAGVTDSSLTTDTNVGTRVEDGEHEASVDCAVSSSGTGYTITASVAQGTTAFFVAGSVEEAADGTFSGSGEASFIA